ncbi:hypothetical protein [Pedobacter sp. NJ-S-72]
MKTTKFIKRLCNKFFLPKNLKPMKNKALLIAFAFAALTSACKKQNEQSAQSADVKADECHCAVEQASPEIKGVAVTFGSGSKTIQLTKKKWSICSWR